MWLSVHLRDTFTLLFVTQQVIGVSGGEWILLLIVELLFSSLLRTSLLLVLSRLEVATQEQQKVLKVLWHRKILQ